jgi:hypothetical protein
MSETQKTHFTERIANLGILFIISGLLSFFGFNNYAPYSYFAFKAPVLTRSFWFGNLAWFLPVIIWSLFPMILSIRLFRIQSEMNNPLYKRFSIFFMVSCIIQFLIPLILMSLYISSFYVASDAEYLPDPEMYFPTIAYIGLGYIAVTFIVQLLQIIAWIHLFILCRKDSSGLGKDIQINFGGAPVIFILSNLVSIGGLTISTIATFSLIAENLTQADFLTMIGTYISFGWFGLNLLGKVLIGIRIFIKPSSRIAKSVDSKKIVVKKVLKSCPVCRNTIYEGETMCKNCGYRI